MCTCLLSSVHLRFGLGLIFKCQVRFFTKETVAVDHCVRNARRECFSAFSETPKQVPNMATKIQMVGISDTSWIHSLVSSTTFTALQCRSYCSLVNAHDVKRSYKHTDLMEPKGRLIKLMNFKSTEDAMPFYKLPIRTLLMIFKVTKLDKASGFCQNRLYYIAEVMKCDATALSPYVSKRSFIYSLSFDWLEKSLKVLMEMGVKPERIMRDLWVLKYHHETIKERLERVQSTGRHDLYPWMVRCSEDILNRSIEISQDKKYILGEKSTTQAYLADRLNTSAEVITDLCVRIPAIRRIQVTKAKSFIDFLLSEGFTHEDIITKARVLGHSLKTVQSRLTQLRSVGIKSINLNILCKSNKDFARYCSSFQHHVRKEKLTKETTTDDQKHGS